MAKNSYVQYLKSEFGALIDVLDLTELQKRFIRSRWLDQVVWMEGKAEQSRRWYYFLRLIAIVGGVTVPTLLSLYLVSGSESDWRWLTFGISLMVAVSAAVEEFFHYGERWRHYRRMVEWLKIEGWKFFQLSDPYAQFGTHTAAYTAFASQIEAILQQDVEGYVSGVTQTSDNVVEKMAGHLSKASSD